MAASEDLLKFFCILKKKHKGGFKHYMNNVGNYWDSREYLSSEGFRSWGHLYSANEETMEGFVACQMRPRLSLLLSDESGYLYSDGRYETPYDKWKFSFRHQPANCPVPDWVVVGEVKAKCIELLPLWAEDHLVKEGRRICKQNMAIVALGDSEVRQHGGHVWTYDSSHVTQIPLTECRTHLHDSSTGFITANCSAFDHSRVELASTGSVSAFGASTVVLRPNSKGDVGTVLPYGPGVRVFSVKSGYMMEPGIPIPNSALVPLEIKPLKEPRPWRVEQDTGRNLPFLGNGSNLPFGCAVD